MELDPEPVPEPELALDPMPGQWPPGMAPEPVPGLVGLAPVLGVVVELLEVPEEPDEPDVPELADAPELDPVALDPEVAAPF